MAKENKTQSVETMPDRCPAEGCKKPIARMHFCAEHFAWYKEGLINKRGQKPSDFDKKYQDYARKKAA
ncbi:MAG: hypothetical protein A2Z20_06110 [Bdellovibrionales bacterium RBG_16_40_8]|nr:MAG: hypothetical protein A2Z20_06110 [Bdellovibrionales bacterium RBG_16_40_8]